MIRDVRNYTTNHSADALSSNHAVGDPSVLELLDDISTVNNRDLGLSSADPFPAASPSGPALAGSSSGPASPPGTSGTGSAPVGAASRSRSACGRGSSRSGRDTRGSSLCGASARGGIATCGGRD